MEANIMFGAEQVIIHNLSMPGYMDRYAEHYVKLGVLQVLPYNFDPIITLESTTYDLQLTTLHDCLYRMRRRTTYMTQVDLDELIVPRHPEDVTWSDMITRSGCDPDSCVYSGRMLYYNRQYSNNTAGRTGLVMLDTTHRSIIVKPDRDKSKYIAHTSKIWSPHMHTASCKRPYSYCTLPIHVGASHHYRREIARNHYEFTEEHGTVIDKSVYKYQHTLKQKVSEAIIMINKM